MSSMGFPLNSYETFKILSNPKDDFYNYVRDSIKDFTLFGLVIHDPKIHTDFDKNIHENFSRFDRHTGENFLFFSLVTPLDEWVSRIRRRSYALFIEKHRKGIDSQLDVYGFCKYLGIDYNDLPVVVLSNSLTFDDLVVIKTDHKYLEKQFELISDFCDHVYGRFDMSLDERFKQLLFNLKIEEMAPYSLNSSSIAQGIVALYSKANYEEVLREIKKLKNINNTQIDDEVSQRIDELILFLSTRLAQSNKYSIPILKLGNDYESESYILQQTFNAVTLSLLNPKSAIDTSIGILPITKIFEIEVNLSFVQYIRETLDIDMPTYFNKPFRNRGNFKFYPDEKIVGNNPKPIDFNQIKNNKFIPPGIGQTEVAVKTLSFKGNLPQEFMDNRFRDFMLQWQTLREIRNLAAHTGSLGEQELKRVLRAFQWLESNGFNRKIIELKNELKG